MFIKAYICLYKLLYVYISLDMLIINLLNSTKNTIEALKQLETDNGIVVCSSTTTYSMFFDGSGGDASRGLEGASWGLCVLINFGLDLGNSSFLGFLGGFVVICSPTVGGFISHKKCC